MAGSMASEFAGVDRASSVERRSRFFAAMSLALAVDVLLGFAATFYLRPFLPHYVGAATLSAALLIHGVLQTAWFALFVAQTWLVASRRIDAHRRLGIAAAVVAAAIPLAAFMVAPKTLLLSVPVLGYVAIALLMRKRPDTHKRLMLAVSTAMVAAASGRVAAYIMIFGKLGQTSWVPFLIAFQSLFVIAALVHDLRERGRPHAATLASIPLNAASIAVALL